MDTPSSEPQHTVDNWKDASQDEPPFLGKLEVNPPGVRSPIAPAQVAQTEKPPGWWSLDLIGTREGVLKAIDAADIPARCKSFLRAEVEAIPDTFNHLELDAHYIIHDWSPTLHLTLAPDTILT